MTAPKLTIWKIEDHEFEGQCGACKRNGLRWLAVLSDGSKVGLECTKKLMGYRPAPRVYNWIPDFEQVAEYVECAGTQYETHWVMWKHKTRAETRETRNGHLMAVGGVRADWTRRGWLVPVA